MSTKKVSPKKVHLYKCANGTISAYEYINAKKRLIINEKPELFFRGLKILIKSFIKQTGRSVTYEGPQDIVDMLNESN
jgi:hypothetical protein